MITESKTSLENLNSKWLYYRVSIQHVTLVISYIHSCWLSSGEGKYAIWTFIAPMLAIILVHTV